MKTKVLNIFYINYKDIPHKWGNFGKIPYGQKIMGRLFYDSTNSNLYCEPESIPKFNREEIVNDDFSPIFLVNRFVLLFYLN